MFDAIAKACIGFVVMAAIAIPILVVVLAVMFWKVALILIAAAVALALICWAIGHVIDRALREID